MNWSGLQLLVLAALLCQTYVKVNFQDFCFQYKIPKNSIYNIDDKRVQEVIEKNKKYVINIFKATHF